MQTDIARVLNSPETRRHIEDQGMTVIASTPAQFDTFVKSAIQRWAKTIADAGIQAE
jgi:tripartite-type tricarboxylate transporter receptor subunit TctC